VEKVGEFSEIDIEGEESGEGIWPSPADHRVWRSPNRN